MEPRVKEKRGRLGLAGIISGEQVRSFGLNIKLSGCPHSQFLIFRFYSFLYGFFNRSASIAEFTSS